MSEKLVETLLNEIEMQRGQIEALSVAVNTLALVASANKPEIAQVVHQIFLDLARKREESSDALDTELTIGSYRIKCEDFVEHIASQ